MWQEVADLIHNNANFVITTHVNPDGDAIGSVIALAGLLQDLGKSTTIVSSSQTPRSCRFLDPHNTIRVYPDQYDPAILEKADVAIATDVNNWPQLGPFAEALRAFDKPRVCIDHHEGVEPGFADVVVSDTSAAAAGLLVFELIEFLGREPSDHVRDAIYTAIITDTGSFRFSNTDARVLRAATRLLEFGANPSVLHRQAFAKTPAAVKLLGSVLAAMGSTADGKLIWLHVTQEMLRAAGANYEDSDGIVDVVRAMEGVEFVLFFKELDDGRVKVSLRSNGRVDVLEIAKRYGGGGHRMACGMTLDGPIDAAIERLVNDCKTSEAILQNDD